MLEDAAREARKSAEGTVPVMAHILFVDIVGFTRLTMDKQRATISELQEIVFNTPSYSEAEVEGRVICRPTGDGMALGFFSTLVPAVQCANSVAMELRTKPNIKVRMGLHSGHVYRVRDGNGNPDIIGEGINLAQRVMDCGDAGHILVSSAAAHLLENTDDWARSVHDLGQGQVKHGQLVHLYNLYTRDIGNRRIPKKIAGQRWQKLELRDRVVKVGKIGLVLLAIFAVAKYGSPYFPAVGSFSKGVWRRMFKPGAKQLLDEARAAGDERKWDDMLQTAQQALALPEANGEQKGEAILLIARSRFLLGDGENARAALKQFTITCKDLPARSWVRQAIKIEPELQDLRNSVEKGRWGEAAHLAERIASSSGATLEQRAEAYLRLAQADTRRGYNEGARSAISHYDLECKKLGEKNWTRAEIASIRDRVKPPPPPPDVEAILDICRSALATDQVGRITDAAQRVLNSSHATREQRAEAMYHLAAAAYRRSDVKTARSWLDRLGDQVDFLRVEYAADARKTAAAVYMQAAQTATDAQQWRTAARSAERVLSELDHLARGGAEDSEEGTRAQAYFYLINSAARQGQREKAQRLTEEFKERCARLISDEPENQWYKAIQEADSTPSQPSKANSEPQDKPEPDTNAPPADDKSGGATSDPGN